ncbi:MAG: hypothetical protein ACRDY6_24135 [Acidimicrobiia bacterium]
MVPMKADIAEGCRHQEGRRFALHCAVEDNQGGGDEVLVTGVGSEIDAPEDFAERGWITFPLRIAEVRSVRHPEHEDRPLVRRWTRDW